MQQKNTSLNLIGLPYTRIVKENNLNSGKFVILDSKIFGFKKVKFFKGLHYDASYNGYGIAVLTINKGAIVHILDHYGVGRDNITGFTSKYETSTYRKLRADKAKVVGFLPLLGNSFPANQKTVLKAKSLHDPSFIYKLGQELVPVNYSYESFLYGEECGMGIHFFTNFMDANNYY